MADLDYRALPKALLHEHLDGGLRPQTMLELATEIGYADLPASDPDDLADWFYQGDSASLEDYLETFEHTVALMQTASALERIAFEAVVDLAVDGVVYAEIRHGTALSTAGDLTIDEATEAILTGLARGASETGMVVGFIPVALRHHDDSEAVARSAVSFMGRGVVSFDLAGPETGYPADDHLDACRICHEAGLPLTLHAGEGHGPDSIFRARNICGALRLGHGVRIVEDTKMADGEIVGLGPLARTIRDQRVPLELAISSNVHTGIVSSVEAHPVGALHRAGFAVTLNTDNRLMSRTTLSAEFELAARHHGFGPDDFLAVTEEALRVGFGIWPKRRHLLEDVVRPYYRGR